MFLEHQYWYRTNVVRHDLDGQFTINNVDKNATIIFSYCFSSQTIKLNGQTTLNISLKPESFKLNDVVVTGYSMRK
jgi:hypothetical protein